MTFRNVNSLPDKINLHHWGEENHFVPSNSQKKQAKYLASLGVDIIIGTHPHVIQPIEWIDDTLVIYSLGNLITAQTSDYDYGRLVGMMVTLDIQKKNKLKETDSDDKGRSSNRNCEEDEH